MDHLTTLEKGKTMEITMEGWIGLAVFALPFVSLVIGLRWVDRNTAKATCRNVG